MDVGRATEKSLACEPRIIVTAACGTCSDGTTLHIVLDNYKPHLKTAVLRWAATHRVRFYFTPTSASWLNRIECQFTALRKFALDHADFRTHEEQQEAITRYLTWRNGRRAISQMNWKNYRRRQSPTKHAERLAA